MVVSAWVGDELCGEAPLIPTDDQVGYVIDVLAADFGDLPVCGYPGDPVDFFIGDWLMNPPVTWDHSQMWQVNLTPD